MRLSADFSLETLEKGKELKCLITRNQLNTEEDSNARNEGQKGIRCIENK